MNTAPDQCPHFFPELGNTEVEAQQGMNQLFSALGGTILTPPATVAAAISGRAELGWSSYIDPKNGPLI